MTSHCYPDEYAGSVVNDPVRGYQMVCIAHECVGHGPNAGIVPLIRQCLMFDRDQCVQTQGNPIIHLHEILELQMQKNTLPRYDDSVNTTGCCAKFNPQGWDGQELEFDDKEFVRASTKSLLHIPLNMGSVFSRVLGHLKDADAYDPDNCIVLSRDLSAWRSEHLFSISKPVPEEEATTLTGKFITKVFEGPYYKARTWHEEMKKLAREKGGTSDEVYFFYTTCPKCARAYGKNYIVGVARI